MLNRLFGIKMIALVQDNFSLTDVIHFNKELSEDVECSCVIFAFLEVFHEVLLATFILRLFLADECEQSNDSCSVRSAIF